MIVEKHYSPRELAELCGIREGTLAQWRRRSHGPSFVKLGRSVRYSAAAVQEWLSQRERVATQAAK